MRNKDYIKEINKEIDSHKNYEQISSKLQFKDKERVFNRGKTCRQIYILV